MRIAVVRLAAFLVGLVLAFPALAQAQGGGPYLVPPITAGDCLKAGTVYGQIVDAGGGICGGGSSAVSSVTGAGTVSCSPTTGAVTCTGSGGASGANPSATATGSAINGTAATFMRSDAAPAIQSATSGQKGLVEVDGTTITASSGTISTAATTINGTTCTPGGSCTVTAAASSLVVGTTSIGSGTTTRVLFDNAGVLGEYAITGSGSVALGTAPTIAGGSITALTTFGLRDTSAAFDLTLAAVSSTALTAGRTLTFNAVNGSRTVKLGSNLTIASDPGAVTGAIKSDGSGTFSQASCADLSVACITTSGISGMTSGQLAVAGSATTITSSVATGTSGHTLPYLDGTNTWSGAQAFGQVNGTTYAVALTSNDYTATISDCGKILLLPTGTTPTITLPNINPASGGCVISAIETTAVQYTPQAASGGTLTANVNGFTKTKGTAAFVNFVLTTPSVSAAVWAWSGDGA